MEVFISYSSADRAYVDRLAAFLRQQGVPVWYDPNIGPGQRYVQVIEEAINACAGMVVVMSHGSKASRWVESECEAAIRQGKPVVPFLLQDGAEFLQLRSTQYVDVRGARLPTPDVVETLRRIAGVVVVRPDAMGLGGTSPAPAAVREPTPAARRRVVLAGVLTLLVAGGTYGVTRLGTSFGGDDRRGLASSSSGTPTGYGSMSPPASSGSASVSPKQSHRTSPGSPRTSSAPPSEPPDPAAQQMVTDAGFAPFARGWLPMIHNCTDNSKPTYVWIYCEIHGSFSTKLVYFFRYQNYNDSAIAGDCTKNALAPPAVNTSVVNVSGARAGQYCEFGYVLPDTGTLGPDSNMNVGIAWRDSTEPVKVIVSRQEVYNYPTDFAPGRPLSDTAITEVRQFWAAYP
jgi:hypothetical protein